MAKRSGSTAASVIHCVGVINTVSGQGNLWQQLFSRNNATQDVLTPVSMSQTSDLEPFSHANFSNQRIAIFGYANNLDDDFVIARIIIFTKPVATMYPQ